VKKRLALVLAGAAAMSTLGVLAAHADGVVHVNTPVGTADADPSTGIQLDGNSTNPDPLDGYIIIDQNGTVSCSDEGGPFNDDGTSKNADTDPNNDFTAPGTCNPTLPPPPVG